MCDKTSQMLKNENEQMEYNASVCNSECMGLIPFIEGCIMYNVSRLIYIYPLFTCLL